MACAEVPAYLRKKLNLPAGSHIGIAVLGPVPQPSIKATEAQLVQAGYEIAGFIRITLPPELEVKH